MKRCDADGGDSHEPSSPLVWSCGWSGALLATLFQQLLPAAALGIVPYHVPNPNLTSNPAETQKKKGAAHFCLRIHNIVGSTAHREERSQDKQQTETPCIGRPH